MEGIPHHLIDSMAPTESYTVGLFHQMATAAIKDILQRGKVPIVVGGTVFYLKWLLFGPQKGGPSDQSILQAIKAQLEEDGCWETSLARLMEQDPLYAKTLRVNDYQKLTRALVKVQQNNLTVTELESQCSQGKRRPKRRSDGLLLPLVRSGGLSVRLSFILPYQTPH